MSGTKDPAGGGGRQGTSSGLMNADHVSLTSISVELASRDLRRLSGPVYWRQPGGMATPALDDAETGGGKGRGNRVHETAVLRSFCLWINFW